MSLRTAAARMGRYAGQAARDIWGGLKAGLRSAASPVTAIAGWLSTF